MLSQQTEKGRRSSMLCRLQRSPLSPRWVGFDIPYLPVPDSFPSLLTPHSSAHLNRWLCRAPVAFCPYSPCLPGILLACSRKAREALEAKAEVMNITAALVQCKVQRTSHLSLETTWALSIPTELVIFAFSALTAFVESTIWQLNREISATFKCHIYQKLAALDSRGTYSRYKWIKIYVYIYTRTQILCICILR